MFAFFNLRFTQIMTEEGNGIKSKNVTKTYNHKIPKIHFKKSSSRCWRL